jgi:O-antigen/teichoic acid export membrane protein
LSLSVNNLWQRARATNPFAADAALTAGTNIFIGAEGMASGIIAARLLGPRGRGQLAAIQTFSGFAVTLAILGMTEAVVYYSARDTQRAGSYVSSAGLIALIASPPILLLAYFLMPLMLAAQSAEVISAGRWYLLMAVVFALVAVPANSLRGRGDFVAWNAIRLVPNILWIGLLAMGWYFSVRNAWVLTNLNIVVQGLFFFPVAYIVVKRIGGSFKPVPREWGGMVRYGFPCALTSVPQLLNLRLDQIAMAALIPAKELGEYAVAAAWSAAVIPLLNALGNVLLPALASRADLGDSGPRLAQATRLAAVLALAGCVVLMALTPLAIVLLFGERYRAAIPSALVLVPAGTFLALNFVLQEGLRALGHPYAVLWSEVTGLLITVAGLMLTLGPLGIMGGAISSLGGYFTVTVALVYNTRRLVGVSASELFWPRADEVRMGIRRIIELTHALGAAAE